jgi:hypothetical protein
MPEETNKGTDKPKRTRKAGEFRYQVLVEAKDGRAAWYDSEFSYKGPTEALNAASSEGHAGEVIRVIRVASPNFTVEAVTTTVLKKRTAK